MHKRFATLVVVIAVTVIAAPTGGAFIFPVWLTADAKAKAQAEAKVKQILEGLLIAIPGAKRVDKIQHGCPWGQDTCWGYNEDGDPVLGGSNGDPIEPEPDALIPVVPGEPGDILIGPDGQIWECEKKGCIPAGGSGSPWINDPVEGPRDPGAWIFRAPPAGYMVISDYVAAELAAMEAQQPYNPDDAALAEWVSWGLDPADFDPCAYAAQKAEREANGG